MAIVRLEWDSVQFKAANVSGWVSFKTTVNLDKHKHLLSSRAVYVIRTKRPYAFSYGGKYSPVAYIGKGQAKIRITAHLKSWIPRLCKKLPDLSRLLQNRQGGRNFQIF